MTPVAFAVASFVVAVGATIQGSVGFGLNVVAAPILLLIDPALVPGPTLVTAVVLTILIAHRERAAVDLRSLRWAFVGRVPGSVAGAFAVAALPARGLAIALAIAVLVAVATSAVGGRWIRPTPGTLAGAGAASGLMGTVSSIGGPPMALVYQGSSGAALRGNLSAFFVFGATLSILLLAGVGEFGWVELRASAILLPGLLLGFAMSRRAARFLDRGFTRPAVLALSTLSALAALIRYA